MSTQRGFSLIEVLVTIIILAFGLLGLAGLQARTAALEMESYQRSQALVLLNDMASRLGSRVDDSGASYVTDGSLGTGDGQPTSCAGVSAGSSRDQCEWSNLLKGSSEQSGGSKIGAMVDARGCITQIQAPDTTSGVCTPGIYEVSVAWQGMVDTVAPSNGCGQGQYGTDASRRVVSLRVASATVGCS
jgi:type IV pilus assembly protein PilV